MKDLKIQNPFQLRPLLAAALLLLLPAPVLAADPADLVLRGRHIHTADPDRPTVEAVAVREGLIVYLGSADGLGPHLGKKTRVIDLGDRGAYPGFVDARTSLYRQALVRGFVDLTGAADYDEVVRRMARAVRASPPNRWVIGWGWDQNRWFPPELPTSFPLEAISMGRALVLFNRGLSAAVLNASGLAQAGIDREIPDPPGGRFVRFRGNPTGCITDRALDEIWNAIPPSTPAEIEGFYRAAADSAVRRGWTAVHEVGLTPDRAAVLERLGAARGVAALPLRVFGIMDARAVPDSARMRQGPPRSRPGSRVEIGGILWTMDGDFSNRGAALAEPYADESWNRGSLSATPEELLPTVRLAIEAGWQPHFEASGDAGVEAVLAVLDTALGGLPAELRTSVRPRLLRAGMLPAEAPARLARLGVGVTVHPGHLPDEMGWIENRLGLKRMDGVLAWRTLSETPVPLAFGTGAPGGPDDPVLLFHAAISRQDPRGRPRAGWYPEERLSRAEALAGLTGGAAQRGRGAISPRGNPTGRGDDGAGTLAVGSPADLTVLSVDIMTVPESEIPRAQAVLTIVGGEVVWERP